MGMQATVLAIGPFSPAIADILSYPAEYYRNTRPGAIVVRELFDYIIDGGNSSTEFAGLLGITDPWDFNQHKIDPDRIDAAGLRAFFNTIHDGDQGLVELTRMLALRDAGFDLIFLPNG